MNAGGTRRVLSLTHLESGRRVPVEVPTVFGRSDEYYHYTVGDERGDRLRDDVTRRLAQLNYIKLSSDNQVSRTHGLINPELPSVADLNSTNGITLNHRPVPTRSGGDAGPAVTLEHSDRLRVGHQVFEVSLTIESSEALQVQVRNRRFGFVGSDRTRQGRAKEVKEFLDLRKGFTIRDAIGWPAIIANFYRLQSGAHAHGIAVCAIFADADGADLVLDGETMPFAKLLPLLSNARGRKIMILETKGDPSTCERMFASRAYEDMVLLTSMGPVLRESNAEELVVPTLQSSEMSRVRESLDGYSPLAGAFDDSVDGIDALVDPETNILNVSWLEGYRGKLKVVFGTRVRNDDEALSHSLRLGSSTFRF